MQLISYSQNNEDILLWRALKNVEKGFYIDVGANHPVDDSVTKLFYENGWSGINIEPVQEKFLELVGDRSRDINVGSIIGSKEGKIKFFEILEDSRLSTTNEETAQKLNLDFGYEIKTSVLSIQTLNSICEKYNVEHINFLKIDVEGGEKDVLLGFDFKKYRPWICVIESTIFYTDEINIPWEDILLSHNYEFVFFDGLNRYYIAKEKIELKSKFSYPAGIHDSYITYNQFLAEKENRELKSIENLKYNQIQNIKNSLSWKITKPLRRLHNAFLKLVGREYFGE
jgi:FkbM family methyltransferase